MGERMTIDTSLVSRAARTSRDDARLVPLPQPAIFALRARDDAQSVLARVHALSALPKPNEVASTPLGDLAWVRPDEWHLIAPLDRRDEVLAILERSLPQDHGAVVDISASRVLFELSGARSRDVLAASCALDLHPRAFGVGRCAQSLIAKAPVFLHLTSDEPRWRILVRPSFAAYVVSWLTDAMEGE